MNTSRILNILLAVAVLILALRLAKLGTSTDAVDTSDIVLGSIQSRSSVRQYTQTPVEPEKIDKMLRAAMAAPTAGNKQPWHFVVITDKDILQKLGETLPYAKMTATAPLAIAVCGDLTKTFEGEGVTYWVQDASAATENLLLAANALGLGAVWTGVYPISARVAEVTSILGLPDTIIPLNVIPIGYPSSDLNIKDKWKPENIHYNKW